MKLKTEYITEHLNLVIIIKSIEGVVDVRKRENVKWTMARCQ